MRAMVGQAENAATSNSIEGRRPNGKDTPLRLPLPLRLPGHIHLAKVFVGLVIALRGRILA